MLMMGRFIGSGHRHCPKTWHRTRCRVPIPISWGQTNTRKSHTLTLVALAPPGSFYGTHRLLTADVQMRNGCLKSLWSFLRGTAQRHKPNCRR